MSQVNRADAVLRLLGGADLVALATELGIETSTLAAWRSEFVRAGREQLAESGDSKLRARKIVSAEDAVRDGIHPDRFVWWDRITQADIDAFRTALDTATCEEHVQAYLTAHPLMLVQPLGGGHGRWVIPKQRLGSEHVTDYVIGDKDSIGYHWTVVELESPHAELFTKRGDESAALRHAIRQVEDWRSWVGENIAYARSESDHGLNLPSISANTPAWVIIGRRRTDRPKGFDSRRQQWRDRYGIEVHSFDWLLDRAEGRLRSLRRLHR